MQKSKPVRRNRKGAHIAEFGAAFVAFFFFVLIPCINVVGFGAGYSLAHSTTSKTADSLSKSKNHKQIVNLLVRTTNSINEKSAFKTLRLEPAKRPIELSVAIENLKGQERIFPLTKNLESNLDIDRSKNMYRYRITTKFISKPILDLSGIPVVGNIPILAAPTPIKLTQYRDIEHPEFLQSEDNKVSRLF